MKINNSASELATSSDGDVLDGAEVNGSGMEVPTAPPFDELARVRASELTAELSQHLVDAVLANYGGEPSGVPKAEWDSIAPKMVAFDREFPGAVEVTYTEYLGLRQDPGWNFEPHWREHTPTLTYDQDVVYKWLRSRGYKSLWGSAATSLSEEYLSSIGIVNRTRPVQIPMDRLEAFVVLDENHDAKLSLPELMPFIDPRDRETGDMPGAMEGLDFSFVARVTAEDLVAVGFPVAFASTIMKTAEAESISKAKCEEFMLQETVNEFVRRDAMGPPMAHKSVKTLREKDDFDGSLKFYQFADALPNLVDKIDGNRDATVEVHGKKVKVHVPTVQEVTKKTRSVELSSKDIANWLIKEHGMDNGSRFTGLFVNKWRYASKLADNVVTWADGRLAGSVRDGSLDEAHEWPDVAGRLTVFVHLDKDNDGKIDFAEAYPYLKHIVKGGCLDFDRTIC